MRVVLLSDVYPPRAGGAGWSTRALALGLREAGHDVTVITTSPGSESLDGLRIERVVARGRKRFAVPRALDRALRGVPADVVHAQHSLSALAALGTERDVPVIVTVRDHWPVCFWSTRISRGALCPGCGIVPMTRCVDGRVPLPAPLSWSAVPYMRWDLSAKRHALRRAALTIAVSEAIAQELRPLGLARVEVIPNVVDIDETRRIAEGAPPFELPERYLLWVGKLEENKGVRLLVPAVAGAKTGLPLVILGEGSQSHALKFDAASANVPLHLSGWTHRDDVLRVMARATAIVFPSLWPEPLSRVLLEALALGTPVAAIDTGGTREIIEPNVSGLLAHDVSGLSDAIARLVGDDRLRSRIVEGAHARSRAFAPQTLIPRYEAAYRSLA